MINKGKVKYKMKEEDEINETKNEFKGNEFRNTNREDVKMINKDNSSKYVHSGD